MGFCFLMNFKSLVNFLVRNHQYFEKFEEKEKKIGMPPENFTIGLCT